MNNMKYVTLLILLFMALLFDIRSYKVPNVLILIGYGIGAICLCIQHGTAGILISLISIAIVWLIFSPFFITRGLGGGDCKLLAWIPLFLRYEWILECYFLIFACAGMVGIISFAITKKRRFRFSIAAFLGVIFLYMIKGVGLFIE